MVPFITIALQLLPLLVKAGLDIAPLIERTVKVLNTEGGPTPEDWDALHADEDRLRLLLQNPSQ